MGRASEGARRLVENLIKEARDEALGLVVEYATAAHHETNRLKCKLYIGMMLRAAREAVMNIEEEDSK